jgi:hypothetical protein
MGYMEIIWTVAFAVWAALLGFGGVVMSSIPPEFRNAHRLFLCSPFPLVVADIMWTMATDRPLYERLIISGILGSIALIAAAESLRWVYQRETGHVATQEAPKSAEKNQQAAAAKPVETPTQPDNFLPNPLTMRNLFDTDFTTGSTGSELTVMTSKPGEQKVIQKIPYKIFTDFTSKTKFIGIYIPYSPQSFTECEYVISHYEIMLHTIEKILSISSRLPGDTSDISSKDLVFSKLIYVYLESDFTLKQLAHLESIGNRLGITIQFRGHAWQTLHWNEKRNRPAQIQMQNSKPE